MFHKNVLSSFRSGTSAVHVTSPVANELPQTPILAAPVRLRLVTSGDGGSPRPDSPAILDLLGITASRCSSFFAEAAVLVLVLALLDRFMLKGRMELNWVVSAFTISLALLAASIATDFSARRWLRPRERK
jgi:hypothetical protein